MATFEERINQLYREFRMNGVAHGRAAFAKHLKVTKGQIGGWLDGVGRPDYETLKVLAENLNVSLLWLLGASDTRDKRIDEYGEINPNVSLDAKTLIEFLQYRHGETAVEVLKKELGVREKKSD